MFDIDHAQEVLKRLQARKQLLEEQKVQIDKELAAISEKEDQLSGQIQTVLNLQNFVSEAEQLLPPEEALTQEEEATKESIPHAEKTVEEKPTKYGMWFPLVKMLKFAFSAKSVPRTLEELLEGYFSPDDWTLETINVSTPGGEKRWTPRTFQDDLKLGNDSMLRKHLAAAYRSLARYHNDLQKNPTLVAWTPLRNLYNTIIQGGCSIDDVRDSFEKWGVQTE